MGGRAASLAAVLCALVMALASCRHPKGSQRPQRRYEPQVAWPPSAPVDKETEILATEIAEEEPHAPPIPGDVPGVSVREGEAAGLYYLEVVYGDADMDDEMPLIVAIHGRGDRARVPGGPFMGLDRPVRIIVPQAPAPLGSGYAWLPVRVGEGKTDILASSLLETAGRLAAMIEEIRAGRAAIGKTIVTGFSQGGLLTFTLAVHHPGIVGEALPNAGWLPPTLVPDRLEDPGAHPPIRSMHGTDDEIITIGTTREAVSRLVALGLDVEFVEFEGVKHEMTPEMNALFHRWLEKAVLQLSGPLPVAMADDALTDDESEDAPGPD